MRQENQNAQKEIQEVQAERAKIMRKLVQTLLKYEHETSFSMQAKTMSSYQGDLDYVRLPMSKNGKDGGKVIMPATKEAMKESTRRHVKNTTRKYPATPGGQFRSDKNDYLQMTSSEDEDSELMEFQLPAKKYA